MGTVRLGKDAVAYYHATAGTVLAGMSAVLSGVSDVTLNMGAGSAKVSTRGSGGWEVELSTLRTLEVGLKIPLDPSDAGYQALEYSYLNSVPLAAAFLTDLKSVAGAIGPVGDFSVAKFDRGEPLEGEVSVDVTLKLAKFTAWCRVGGATQIAFTTQPATPTVTAVAFATQPVVTIQDATGATIATGADATATVTLALTTGAGVLGGTVSMVAVAGVADFAGKGVKITGAGTGQIITAVAGLASGTKTAACTPVAITAE